VRRIVYVCVWYTIDRPLHDVALTRSPSLASLGVLGSDLDRFLLQTDDRIFPASLHLFCIFIGVLVGRPFLKRFALCYQTVVCLSVLSVTLVYCSQTVGLIKMKLGMQVGLGPGHIVNQLPLLKRGTAPNFRPMSVVAKRLDGLRCHFVRR